MKPIVKKFIENHSALLLESDYTDLYSAAAVELTPDQIGNLTEILLSVGINLLEDRLTILPGCFLAGSSIKNIDIPDNIKAISVNAFWKSAIQHINLPNSLEIIGEGSFSGAQELTENSIGDNVAFLGDLIFNNCLKLEKVHIGSCGGTLPRYIFNLCTSLKQVEVPKDCKTIKEYAFCDCSSLEELILPSNVELDLRAITGCPNLKVIKFSNTAKEAKKLILIKTTVFRGPRNCTVQCTDGKFKIKEILPDGI